MFGVKKADSQPLHAQVFLPVWMKLRPALQFDCGSWMGRPRENPCENLEAMKRAVGIHLGAGAQAVNLTANGKPIQTDTDLKVALASQAIFEAFIK